MAVFTQNPFPLEYSPKIKVVLSDPDRLPYVPVQILYLIAKALPKPSQVFNLARVNKETWYYLQPALYECEVTYEARLVAHFGIGRTIARTRRSIRPGSNINSTGQTNDSSPNHDDSDNYDQSEANYVPKCPHALVTTLCEVCGQRIAMKEKHFRTGSTNASLTWVRRSSRTLDLFDFRGLTALHWACGQGKEALPVARKAIEAAKVHQPSYIDGRGLRMRRFEGHPFDIGPIFGEIPPPLFIAAAFGTAKLCEALVESGCNVNLHQAKDFRSVLRDGPLLRIPESCHCHPNDNQILQWGGGLPYSLCETAGHFALESGTMDALNFLLDRGLDPLSGEEALIHRATRTCNLPAVKTILGRFPEMISIRWNDLTLLHVLCKPSGAKKKDVYSLEKLKSVAAYLVQKGALLEAEGGRTGPRLTPLQYAVRNSMTMDSDKLHAPEALVMVGAVWNRFVALHGTTILNHCVLKAASWMLSYDMPDLPRWMRRARGTMTPEKRIEHGLVFAKLVKAVVRSTNPSPGQGGEPPAQAFLHAFRKLSMDRDIVAIMAYDAFAIETVGRLLLSTGISPDQGDMEKWRLLIACNAQGQTAAEWAESPWRELISDLPDNVGGE